MTQKTENAQDIPARIVDTIEAAAGATGYGESLLQALKARGLAAFKNGRVNLDELEAWAAENPEEMERIETETDESDHLDSELLREKLRRLRHANDIQADLYLAKAAVSIKVETLASELKNTLRLRLEEELPRELAGKHEEEIRIAMAAVVDELCEKFSTGTEWTK